MRCWKLDLALRPSASDVLADTERAISTNEPNSWGCFPGFPAVDLVDDVRQVTLSNRLICSRDVDFEHPMNQESSVSDREPVAVGARHFTGVGAITTSDYHISPTVDVGMSLSCVGHLHHTSHVVSSIRATDDLEVVPTLPSTLEGHAQPDWRPPFDIEASEPRSTRFEPANSIQLASVAQPFLEVVGASILT